MGDMQGLIDQLTDSWMSVAAARTARQGKVER